MRPPRLTVEFAAGAVCALTVAWVGFDDGGFFPPVWGWTALGLAWVASLGLVLREPFRIQARLLAFPAGLALVTVWEAVSLAWSSDVTVGVENLLRDLVYVTAALVVVALASRSVAVAVPTGVLCGAVALCGWSALTHLLPDRLGFYNDVQAPGRLSYPLGYWNAQGALAALAILLLAGVVAGAARPLWRGLAAAALPVCALDCYFALSRGALIALAIGLVAMLAMDPRRARTSAWLLLAAPWPAMAVIEAHRQQLLTGSGYGPAAVGEGHHVAWILLALTLIAGVGVGAAAALERRIRVPRSARISYAIIWALGGLLVAGAAVDRYGTPSHMARSGYQAFTAPPPTSLTSARLLSLSLNGRTTIWAVAWRDARRHPVAGSGAGTYEQRWLAERPYAADTRWAHSLYLEVLAETGVVGLILLGTTLALPLMAAGRARTSPLMPAVFGVYVAFLVHAGVDWDWQVPGVSVAALWCGMALLAADISGRSFAPSRWLRGVTLAAALAAAIVAVVGLVGNRDLSISVAASRDGHYGTAVTAARAAATWAPWSYLPWMAIGQAKLATGDLAGAQTAYRAAIDRDSGRWDAWLALAQTLTGAQRKNALREARRLNPLAPQISEFCDSNPGPGCHGPS